MEKEKRQKRFGQKIRHVMRQLKIRKLAGLEPWEDNKLKEPHRLQKQSAANCGNPNCVMCMNPRKQGELTIQEESFSQTERWIEP